MGQNYGYPNPGQQAVIAKLEQRVAQLEHALDQERAQVARLTDLLDEANDAMCEDCQERLALKGEE